MSSGRPAASSEPSVIGQDHEADHHAHALGVGLRLLGDDAAAELDLEAGVTRGLGRGGELVAGGIVDLVGGHGVDHVGVGDPPVLA